MEETGERTAVEEQCSGLEAGWGGGLQSEIRSPGGLLLKTCYNSEVEQMRD